MSEHNAQSQQWVGELIVYCSVMPADVENNRSFKNAAAYWFLGLCNNFAYVVMLSAAKDIIENGDRPQADMFDIGTEGDGCPRNRSEFHCSSLSTGTVLLADIIPSFIIKLIAPFFFSSIAYNVRMVLVVILQALSFILVATSTTVIGGLFGVVFASLGSGLGDVTLLSLASHFPSFIIVAWASGTGFAGVSGSLAYAALTDTNICNLSPRTALYLMLSVTILFCYSFFKLLSSPSSVHSAVLWKPWTFMIPLEINVNDENNSPSSHGDPQEPLLGSVSELDNDFNDDLHEPLITTAQINPSYTEPEARLASDSLIEPTESLCETLKPLIKYMIPLCIVYYGEYLINQGLFEFVIFDCDHGMGLSQSAQYRWYQVLYQIGVFLSRSSVSLFIISSKWLPLFAALQIINALGFTGESIFHFLNHIIFAFLWILYEGLLGGLSYANTFANIHRTIPRRRREFSLSFVTMADSIGILLAGFTSIPVHNNICRYTM